jgi:hypothetical protein
MRIEEGRASHDEIFTMPVIALTRLHTEQGELIFTARPQTITRNIGREQKKESYYAIKFDFQTEPDIKSRLVSAFSHLQKFYKVQKKKEVF